MKVVVVTERVANGYMVWGVAPVGDDISLTIELGFLAATGGLFCRFLEVEELQKLIDRVKAHRTTNVGLALAESGGGHQRLDRQKLLFALGLINGWATEIANNKGGLEWPALGNIGCDIVFEVEKMIRLLTAGDQDGGSC